MIEFQPAMLLDLALIAVVVFTVLYYLRLGFMASLFDLAGNFGSLAVAWFVSGKLSPTVFENFFKSGLISKTANTIQQYGTVNLNVILDGLSGILPQKFIDSIVAAASGTLDSNAPNVAQTIVEQVVAPLIVPIISIVVFFATYALCKILVSFLVAILGNVNKIPIVGGANKLLGVLIGLIGGTLYVLLILCLIWGVVAISAGKISFLNEQTLSGSYLYAAFSKYNPFL